ncbi:hypothetical protein KTT_57740 [Tengunoibacter tsumagoiensis]|uniref:Major facilitator superfamily (MFS) profile domain-containing protein n=1 Tax=Tengunoibacter tsumagoiensis TaxID=2014871 RepID=A0A402AAD9_9CHLR|nr:hypothetical protein KTT_57740 [Tengunoibacter tsumagoiensis]
MRYRVWVAFFALLLVGLNDGVIGILIPSFRSYYHVNDATIGLLFLCSTLGYLPTTLSSGWMMEKLGLRTYLITGILLYVVLFILLSLHPPFVMVMALLFLIGACAAIVDPGFNAYIATFPDNTVVFNFLHAFYGLGALIGPLLASSIIALSSGWNLVYAVEAAAAAVLLAGFLLAFRSWQETPHGTGDQVQGNIFLATLRLRLVTMAAFFLLFYVGVEVSTGAWGFTFLTDLRLGVPLQMGWIISGYWTGLTLGRIILANMAHRIGDKWLIQLCLLGVLLGLLLTWTFSQIGVNALGLGFMGFCLGPIFPTTIALLSRRVPGRLMPSAIGLVTGLGSMGAALFSWLAGNSIQHLGLWFLMPYEIILTLLMIGCWLIVQSRAVSQQAGLK